MIHYGAVYKDLTVNQFIEILTKLKEQGLGEDKCKIYDPESEDWECITGFTYNTNNEIKFYSDDND